MIKGNREGCYSEESCERIRAMCEGIEDVLIDKEVVVRVRHE